MFQQPEVPEEPSAPPAAPAAPAAPQAPPKAKFAARLRAEAGGFGVAVSCAQS